MFLFLDLRNVNEITTISFANKDYNNFHEEQDKYWLFFKAPLGNNGISSSHLAFCMKFHKDAMNIYTCSEWTVWLKGLVNSWSPSFFKPPLLCIPSILHKALQLPVFTTTGWNPDERRIRQHLAPALWPSSILLVRACGWQVSIFNITLLLVPRDISNLPLWG